MEKRTVRIYKAPDGKGKYINKTNQFLKKAQEGAQVNEGPEQYIQYIQSELQKQTAPEEIYTALVQAGIPEESAQGLIQHVMQGMSQGTPAEDQEVGESEMQYQPDMSTQFQDGGQQAFEQYGAMQEQEDPEKFNLDQMIEDTPGTQDIKFPGMENYMPTYDAIGWDETNTDPYGNFAFQSGGTKKSFAKNVLNFLKEKQEGGQDKTLGKGNPMDTSTDTVTRRKADFLATLKNSADKAKTEEVYDKIMQSGDPSMMQIANTLGQGNDAQPIPLAPIAQTGGFTGGQDPMEYFQDGGYDAQYAQDGAEVRKAKINYVPRVKTVPGGLRNLLPWNQLMQIQHQIATSNPYNVNNHSAYTGSFEGYHPVERKVTKTGLFGRPKEWTDVYSNSPQKTNRIEIREENKPFQNPKHKGDLTSSNLKHAGLSDDVWDDLSFKAKHAIRKGDRQVERNEKRYNKQLEKDKEFENFGNGRKGKEYLFAQDQDLKYHLKHDDDKVLNWKPNPHDYKHPSQKQDPYVYHGSVWQTHNARGEKLKNKEEVVEQITDFVPNDPRFDNDQMNKELAVNRYGGLHKYFKQVGGVNNPKPFPQTSSNATAMAGELTLPANPNSFASTSQHFMNQNVPVNKDPQGPVYEMDPRMNGSINKPEENTIAVDHKRKRNLNTNGEEAVNVFNAGAQGVLGFINRRQQAKQEKDFLENNFTADNIYAHSNDKDRGDWVDYGSQLGQYRFDQMGQSANGRFSYGQSGGFMQEGGITEGDEVEMTEEELQEFLANGGEVEYL